MVEQVLRYIGVLVCVYWRIWGVFVHICKFPMSFGLILFVINFQKGKGEYGVNI